MGRDGKVGDKHGNTRRRVRPKERGSDESDEDFEIDEGEEYESDEYCSSLDPDESEDALAEFELEEEEEEEEAEEVKLKVKKAARSNARKSVSVKRGKRVKKRKPPKKKKKSSYKHEDEDEDEDDDDVEFLPDEMDYVDDEDEMPTVRQRISYKEVDDVDNDGGDYDYLEDEDETPVEDKKRVSYKELEDDCDNDDCGDDDYVDDEVETQMAGEKGVYYKEEDFGANDDGDDDDDEDEEFTLDGTDFLDEEDDMPAAKKIKKVCKTRSRESGLAKLRKRKRNSEVPRPTWKKPRTNRRLMRKTSSGTVAIPRLVRKASSGSDAEFAAKGLLVEERSKKIPGRRRRRYIAGSDSDFMSSGSSDYEYTISEEEREQVREANKFCTSLTTGLRTSALSNKFKEEEDICKQRKRPGRKGKEKLVDLNKAVKQVCGICLSEEGKRTIRGTLNCCSHYFCFACIMEWSKVETRCPLCKQRFMTISKPARPESGFDLRTIVIQVPERDQVYQPSEEELRGFLDPYDGVICTECHQGGDDALMLLCDICDSPAHTYCVGLGHEVPEGNWYCEGCRPAACGSLHPHGLNHAPDQRANNDLSVLSSPGHNVGELDLNSLYVPDTPLTQEPGGFPIPRRLGGEFNAASPASGSGAFTVSDRRRMHRNIHIIRNNRRNPSSSQSNATPVVPTNSGIRLFGSQIDRGTEIAIQRNATPERRGSQYTFPQGRLQESNFPLHPGRGSSHLSGLQQNPFPTSINGNLEADHEGMSVTLNSFNSRLAYEQLHPCSSRSNINSDGASYAFREVSYFTVEKGQVQQMVRSHLKSLSREIELDHDTFKDISRISTHTILATCGHEHRESQVYPVQRPSTCNHIERPASDMQMSLIEGCCSYCFDLFVEDVVKKIMSMKVSCI